MGRNSGDGDWEEPFQVKVRGSEVLETFYFFSWVIAVGKSAGSLSQLCYGRKMIIKHHRNGHSSSTLLPLFITVAMSLNFFFLLHADAPMEVSWGLGESHLD